MSEDKQSLENFKKILITALLTGGTALQGWQVQGHGNRSSHSFAEIRWSYDDYVINRESLFDINSPNTRRLRTLDNGIETIMRQRATFDRETGVIFNQDQMINQLLNKTPGFKTPDERIKAIDAFNTKINTLQQTPEWQKLEQRYAGGNSTPVGPEKIDRVTVTDNNSLMRDLAQKKKQTSYFAGQLSKDELGILDTLNTLVSQKRALENELILQPLTKQVMERVSQGNFDNAAAVIESTGSPSEVINNYIWTQLDLQNSSALNPDNTQEVIVTNLRLSEHAIAYTEKSIKEATDPAKKKELQFALGALYNNVANFASPDYTKKGSNVPASVKELGRESAIKALNTFTALGDQGRIVKAKWMVGYQYYVSGKNTDALKYFREATAGAIALKDDNEKAWGLLYQALILKSSNAASAKQLYNQAKTIFTKSNDKTGLAVIDVNPM